MFVEGLRVCSNNIVGEAKHCSTLLKKQVRTPNQKLFSKRFFQETIIVLEIRPNRCGSIEKNNLILDFLGSRELKYFTHRCCLGPKMLPTFFEKP